MNTSKSSLRLYVGANILSVVLALILNYLAVSLPLNNKTTGELSAMYPNYFVPAGFTFFIWGIIYLLIIVFMLYQAWKVSVRDNTVTALVMAIGPWFFFSGLANACWIIAWHYEAVVASVLIMIFLFYCLVKIYLAASERPVSLADKLCVRLPFSVYLGWISVALIANVTAVCISAGWDGDQSGHFWAIAMIVVATLLGIVMVYHRQDVFYTLVIAWALFGIYSKQAAENLAGSASVATTAKYAMTLLLIYAVLNLIGKKMYLFEDHKKSDVT